MATKTKATSLDISKFQLLGDNVLVKALKSEGIDGLVNPEQYEDKPEYGDVIQVGDTVEKVKVGNIVLFGMYSTEKIRSAGQDYYLVHEEDIKAFLK